MTEGKAARDCCGEEARGGYKCDGGWRGALLELMECVEGASHRVQDELHRVEERRGDDDVLQRVREQFWSAFCQYAASAPPPHGKSHRLADNVRARQEVALEGRQRAKEVGHSLVVQSLLELAPSQNGVDPERRRKLNLVRAEVNPGVDLRSLEKRAPSQLRVAAQACDVTSNSVALEDDACTGQKRGASMWQLGGGASASALHVPCGVSRSGYFPNGFFFLNSADTSSTPISKAGRLCTTQEEETSCAKARYTSPGTAHSNSRLQRRCTARQSEP